MNSPIRKFDKQTDKEDPWEGILGATNFSVQSTYPTMLNVMPGQLVFGLDMI